VLFKPHHVCDWGFLFFNEIAFLKNNSWNLKNNNTFVATK
jgi:hypothetical protein